jgi:multisubunit Na+/H+ antiporter MnhB subunit
MSSAPPIRVCPHCGAEYQSRQGRCWLCGTSLAPDDSLSRAGSAATGSPAEVNPYSAPPSSGSGESTFALSTLFLIITLIAVCLGVIGLAPGLGLPLIVVVTLALVRTRAVSKRQAGPAGLSSGDKVGAFLGSAGIVVLVLVAAGIAFEAACWASCGSIYLVGGEKAGGAAIIVGLIAGVAAAVAISGVLLRSTWPAGKRKPQKSNFEPPRPR